MSTILIYTSPAQGHLYPVMDVALELQRRGHRVHVRTLAAAGAVVGAAGLEASSLAPAIEARAIDDWQVTSQVASAKRSIRTFVDRAAIEVGDLRRAIAEVRPDLLLIDTNAWGAQAVAEAEGIPWATWHPFPLPLPDPDVPPFGPGLPPARGPLGRVRDALLRPLVIGPMQAFLEPLNRVRRSVGARSFGHITELFLAPPAILYRTAEPFEYHRRHPPANLHLIGPGLWSPPAGPAPAWLEDDRPILLVTCSSEYQNDGALAQAAIDAFGADPRFRLVCTTAGVDPATVRAPSGVIVERFASHALVLPRALGLICHGGMGATQRALAAGVAPVVVPFGRDQLEVAQRVVQAGAGAMVPRARLTPERLRDAVERARGCAAGVAAVQAGYVAAGGAERGAALLEGLLGARDRAVA